MLKLESPILNLLLLVLGIPFDLNPDIGYKGGGLSKTLLEKSFEFVLNKKTNTITLNLGLVLLPAKVDLIPEE